MSSVAIPGVVRRRCDAVPAASVSAGALEFSEFPEANTRDVVLVEEAGNFRVDQTHGVPIQGCTATLKTETVAAS